jgi:Ca2+-binding RTX toxin-like protein
LIGGNGRDRFYLSDTRTGEFDIITDLKVGQDTILISKTEFRLSQALGTLDPGLFRLGSHATAAGDRFIYNNTTGQLFFDEDGIGSAAKIQIGLLSNKPTITSSNITIAA